MQYHHNCYPNILFIIILLLKSIISSPQIPIMIYNLADETPTGSLIGNIAENLSFSSIRNYTYLFITSMKFQYINDYIKITSNGDIITLRHIDRDNTNDICGPLNCCPLLVCQIEANIILTKQWNTHWKHDLNEVNHSFMKDHRTPDEDEEQLRRNSIKLNESNEQQIIIHLYIRINDANDNPPRFFMSTNMIQYDSFNRSQQQLLNRPFIIYIREGDTNGFEGLPIASDADSELNGIVKYKLIEYTNNGDPVKEPRLNITMTYDHIHSINPKLILLRSLDYEHIDDREIYATFYAIDGGDSSLTGSLSIIIRLLDMNDNPPIIMKQFTKPEQYITLPENTTLDNKPFYIVNATDADSGENSRLIYSFSPLANSLIPMKFHIDSINGAITIREPLDYEVYSQRQFLLPIIVKDSGSPPLSCTTSISIQIKDINDNIPTLMIQENMTIPEGQLFTKPIIRFYIKDEDEVSHGKYIKIIPDINFHYKQVNQNELMNEYELKAILINQLIIDREKINKIFYQIITYNTDNNNNLKSINSITYTLTINILDENDNIPICIYPMHNSIIGDYDPDPDHDSDPDHSIMIYTNTPIYTFVIQLKGYDPDHGLNGTILYQLNPLTNGSQYFYLEKSNGKLYTNWFMDSAYDSTMFNMDTNPSYDPPIEGIYHIKISLKDMGIPTLSSNETQFFIKIHSFNPSIINNQSIIHSNQKTIKFWLSNHHHQNQFLWILWIISMILLIIIIISSIMICIQSYCKQKFNHPIIISTTTTTKNHDQSLKKPYLISYTNIIHQSINDHLNVNTTTSSDTTYNDPFHYTNHLHTNPMCSLPFSYDTGNHSNNNNTNVYYYHNNNQLIGQKYTSLNASNLSINHLNSSMNGTLTNDHLNHDVLII
ncbi:protocadherin alpha [Schistosoma bovis]|uniref:Protocadherin alpha n=1 Tax=Schistosoma bovis TaxID=6184 RepID=A0A430QAN4_SCHBO|nr:protocadherin alpha [Schistosoma bovis]